MIRSLISIAALVFILGAVNTSILKKEEHLETGRVVFLELAPVDPRSLMQGDYMALRFQVANDLTAALPRSNTNNGWRKVDSEDGWVALDVDARGIGQFASVATSSVSAANQLNLAFRVRSGTVKFATNAFFFEEGTGNDYEKARYGEFRVNADGEPLLVSMRDKDLRKLEVSRVTAE